MSDDLGPVGKLVGIVTLIGAFSAGVTGCNIMLSGWDYSDGTRNGVVTKISNKGLFFKTNEGEMAVANMKSTGDSMNNTFEFSVRKEDEAVLKQIQDAQGHCLKLHYKQTVGHKFWEQDTGYRITKVEDMGPKCAVDLPAVMP